MCNTKKILQILIILFVVFFLFPEKVSATTTLLHEFSGTIDGSVPLGSLTRSGNVLYGNTAGGGSSDMGVLFSINTDGSGFTLLHEFAGGGSDGNSPSDFLLLSNGVLYGTTTAGGDSNFGVIFSINTDGTGYTNLHEFAGGGSDGKSPDNAIAISGGVLYGMTYQGGDSNKGVIYSINTDGSGFTLLHEFAGGGSDGSNPPGTPIISGTKMYGVTYQGGDSNFGTVFSINTDGSGFTLLHEFAGGGSDGKSPGDSIFLSDGKLYGTTIQGGDSNLGVLFSINTDGSYYTHLHEFSGSTTDGSSPYGTPTVVIDKIYGLTSYGGSSDKGSAFSINTDGSNYNILHEFTGGTEDGDIPGSGELVIYANQLFGLTAIGGNFDLGTIYSLLLAPIITLTSDVNSTTDRTPSFNGTAEDNTATVTLVEYQVDSTSGSWTACSSDDGSFDESSETFTCNISSDLSIDSHIIYFRSTDSLDNTTGSDSYITDNITIIASTDSPSLNNSPEIIQIPQSSFPGSIIGNLVVIPIKDSNTMGQEILAIIPPQTFIFDAYLSANWVSPYTLVKSVLFPSTPCTGCKHNIVYNGWGPGTLVGVKSAQHGLLWQVGNIQEIWYKAYPSRGNSAAKIIPELQSKLSMIALKYKDQELIPPGKPKTKFTESKLKLAYSIDGKFWTILPNATVDTINNTVAVATKVGGYYMIVGKY